jgi:hypothetical protein
MATYYLDYEGGDDYRCEQSPYERGVLTAQNMGADVAGRFGIAANFTGAGSGSTAALFTGTSLANVSIPANTPFCLETFVQFTSNNAAADQTAMGFWSSAAGNLGWRLGTTSSGQLALQYTTGGTTVITVGGAYTPTTGVWVHLCAERDVSNVIKVYAAGVQIATATDSSAFFASTLAFVIGNINSAFNAKFPGYVDSCRVTIGKTRYGAAFTPPTGAFGVGGMSNDSLWNYVAMLYTFSGDGTGTSFANRWKTFTLGATAARIAPGDTVRVMASPEPTSLGNATWTNLSNTVTLATMATAVVEGATSATGFAWTGLANVTVSGDTNGYKNGPSGVQFVFASAFTTGLAAYVRRIDESADVAAHRYWRLLFLSTNSVDTQAAEVEMRESTGGVDATGSGTASASSVFSSPTWDAANAFDNNNATAWNSSGFASPTYLAYDFGVGVTKNIKEISLRVRSDFINNAPISFQIQYSDDNSTWTTSWTVTGQTGWTFSEARVFTKPTVSIAPIDLSAYQQVSFWLYTNTAITAGEFSLRLCSDTAGATVVNNLPIPAISLVNAWVPITIDNGSALGSNINSVALYADADPGTTTLHLNTIIACKAPSAADSLNFHSLIGKVCNLSWAATTAYSLNDERRPTQTNRNGFRYRVTTAGTSGSSEPVWPDILTGTVTDGSVVWTCYEVEDTWYALRNISGTTLTLDGAPSATTGTVVARGYSGVTETVATYKREPVLAAIQTDFNATINAVNDSGTTSSLITFEGGWDRSAMSSKSGESWTSGRTGYGWGVGSPGSQVNFELNNLHMVRFAYGLFSNAITGNGVIRYINCSGNNCHAGGFLSNNGPVKHFHKGGAYVLNGNSAPAWNLGGTTCSMCGVYALRGRPLKSAFTSAPPAHRCAWKTASSATTETMVGSGGKPEGRPLCWVSSSPIT